MTKRCTASPMASLPSNSWHRSMARERRRLRVVKYRGQSFWGGYHDYTITRGGVTVFPASSRRNIAATLRATCCRAVSPELDALLGGGIRRGSSALLIGPSGAGQVIAGAPFMITAIARGEKAALYLFEEELGLFIARMEEMGFDLAETTSGRQAHPRADQCGGAVAGRIRPSGQDRRPSEGHPDRRHRQSQRLPGVEPQDQLLALHMHELLQFLNGQGRLHLRDRGPAWTGRRYAEPGGRDLSQRYRHLLRYFEAMGRVCRAMSVIKKRGRTARGHHPCLRDQ